MTIVALALAGMFALDEPPKEGVQNPEKLRAKELGALVNEFFKEKQGGGALRWAYFAPRFMALAAKDPSDRVGFEALSWFAVQAGPDHPGFARSMDLLTLHHAQSWRCGLICGRLLSPRYYGPESERVERLVSGVADQNENRELRAAASFGLAEYLRNKAELARLLKGAAGRGLARRIERFFGKGYVETLTRSDADELFKRGRDRLERSVRDYPDYSRTHVALGMPCPEIRGEDIDGAMMRLSDFRGSVVMLSFWGFGCVPCRYMFPQERGAPGQETRGQTVRVARREQRC